MPGSPIPRILIVDDEAAQMRALCDTLRDHGYHTVGFTDGAAALETLRASKFELLLTDLTMPGLDGVTLLEAALKVDHDLVGLIMTGQGTIASAVAAMKTGAFDYILKPFKLSVILPVLARALAVRHLRIANAELELSVRQRTLELEAANKELEAFARSVSHDLRSPLGVILCNADMLVDDYAARMPVEALPLANDIIASAVQMRQLIEDLLRLSRLGLQPIAKQPIDVSALVHEVLRELERGHGEQRVEVRLGDLPDCVGDPGLLKQVFANLLSNAFKFTRVKEMPIVELNSRQ